MGEYGFHHLPPSLSQSIIPQIARKWPHNLGFCPISSKKGLYFDEHKQDDVVKYSKLFLCEIEIPQFTHLPHLLVPLVKQKKSLEMKVQRSD